MLYPDRGIPPNTTGAVDRCKSSEELYYKLEQGLSSHNGEGAASGHLLCSYRLWVLLALWPAHVASVPPLPRLSRLHRAPPSLASCHTGELRLCGEHMDSPATQEIHVCVENIWAFPPHRRSMFVWRIYGLSFGASSKEPTYQFRRLRDEGSIPSVGKIPWRRKWHPTLVFLPGDSPWTEEPGRLQSMELQRVGHNWETECAHTHSYLYGNTHLRNIEMLVREKDAFLNDLPWNTLFSCGIFSVIWRRMKTTLL